MNLKHNIKRCLRFVAGHTAVKVSPRIACIPPNELLQGRTALITGGTSGIGLAIAKAYVRSGAAVVITGRSADRINKACEEIRAQAVPKAFVRGIELDNRHVSDFSDIFNEVLSIIEGRQLDILVNNAGLRGGHISKCTEDEYDNIMDTNVKGTFFLTQLMAHYMINNGIHGNILNISSASSIRPAVSAYHISKWAVRGLTEGMARSLAPYGICVNAIAPGPTATPMLGKDGRNDSDFSHPKNLLGRYAAAEEIANMAVILVSDMSHTIVGDTIFMSGGGGIITNEDVDFKF